MGLTQDVVSVLAWTSQFFSFTGPYQTLVTSRSHSTTALAFLEAPIDTEITRVLCCRLRLYQLLEPRLCHKYTAYHLFQIIIC